MFRKNTIKCFAFLISGILIIYPIAFFISLFHAGTPAAGRNSFSAPATTGETSLARMTVYLDRFYSASVKRKTDDRKEQVKAKKNNRKKIKKKSNIYDTLANAGHEYENLGI